MGKYVTLTLSADTKRKAIEARRLPEVNTYLREVERIMDLEFDRVFGTLAAFGSAELPRGIQ